MFATRPNSAGRPGPLVIYLFGQELLELRQKLLCYTATVGTLFHSNSLHYGRAEAQTKTISPLSFLQFYFHGPSRYPSLEIIQLNLLTYSI